MLESFLLNRTWATKTSPERWWFWSSSASPRHRRPSAISNIFHFILVVIKKNYSPIYLISFFSRRSHSSACGCGAWFYLPASVAFRCRSLLHAISFYIAWNWIFPWLKWFSSMTCIAVLCTHTGVLRTHSSQRTHIWNIPLFKLSSPLRLRQSLLFACCCAERPLHIIKTAFFVWFDCMFGWLNEWILPTVRCNLCSCSHYTSQRVWRIVDLATECESELFAASFAVSSYCAAIQSDACLALNCVRPISAKYRISVTSEFQFYPICLQSRYLCVLRLMCISDRQTVRAPEREREAERIWYGKMARRANMLMHTHTNSTAYGTIATNRSSTIFRVMWATYLCRYRRITSILHS